MVVQGVHDQARSARSLAFAAAFSLASIPREGPALRLGLGAQGSAGAERRYGAVGASRIRSTLRSVWEAQALSPRPYR
jgi:hypothetical protein